MDNLKKAGAVLLLLAIGVGFGRYLTPAEINIKTETIEVEKIVAVEKVVYVKEETRKTDSKKITETKKTTKPDGTVIEETKESNQDTTFSDNSQKVIKDKAIIKENISTNTKKTEKKHDTKKAHVSILAGVDSKEFNGIEDLVPQEMVYGIHASYSFFGPISVGMFGTTSKEFGLSVGLDF